MPNPTKQNRRVGDTAHVGKNPGFPKGKARRVRKRGAHLRKNLGVSGGNARRVGERGAQNRGELATGGPNQVNRKRQRQRCGGEKTWGFQRERETAGKRSAQNRSEWSRGAPKTEASGQEERPTNKTERTATVARWGKYLGFPDRTQGESARGAPKTEASRQEERPTNKTERASDRGAVGKKLGVSRGNARRVGQRGDQNRVESPRGAPNQEIRRGQKQRCGGEKTWGFQRESKASWPNGRPKPKQVFNRSAKTQHKASSRDGRPNEKLVRTREH